MRDGPQTRDREGMTRTVTSEIAAFPPSGRTRLIDMGDALDLLARAVNKRGENYVKCHSRRYAVDGQPQSIVGDALLDANVTVRELEAMRGHRLRDLYREAGLPVDLTLGGLIVLDAAQRSEDRGSGGADVLDDATAAAAKFLDLVTLVPEVTRHLHRRGGRCERFAGRA